jgi:MFS family permease
VQGKYGQYEGKESVTPKVVSPGKGGVFYGWFAITGAMLIIFVVGGSFAYSYGVFLPVICEEFGWSRASVGAGMSLGFLAFGLPSPLFGVMVARFGPRVNLVLGNILAALGFAGMYLVQEVWHIYIIYSFVGLTAGLGGYIAAATVINNWFIKKRSLALGIFLACGGLGGFIFAPITSALISSVGWRLSWVILGGIILVVAVLIGGLVLVRDRPEDMGQLPDGASAGPFVETGATEYPSGAGVRQEGWQARQALQLPTTWLIAAFTAAGAFIMGAMSAHQIAYLQDSGFAPMTAAMTMSIIAVSGVIGSLGYGALALRFNIRYLASIGFAGIILALVILLTTKNVALIYVYSVFLGVGHGAVSTALPTFIGAYYRRDHYARVLGIILPFQVVAQAAAATIAGAIYDATNTYIPAFIIAAAFSLAGLLCVFLARQPKLPQPNN